MLSFVAYSSLLCVRDTQVWDAGDLARLSVFDQRSVGGWLGRDTGRGRNSPYPPRRGCAFPPPNSRSSRRVAPREHRSAPHLSWARHLGAEPARSSLDLPFDIDQCCLIGEGTFQMDAGQNPQSPGFPHRGVDPLPNLLALIHHLAHVSARCRDSLRPSAPSLCLA